MRRILNHYSTCLTICFVLIWKYPALSQTNPLFLNPGTPDVVHALQEGANIQNTGTDALVFTLSNGVDYLLKASVVDGANPGILTEIYGRQSVGEGNSLIKKQFFNIEEIPLEEAPPGLPPPSPKRIFTNTLVDPDLVLGKKIDPNSHDQEKIYLIMVALKPYEKGIYHVAFERFEVNIDKNNFEVALIAKIAECNPHHNLTGRYPTNEIGEEIRPPRGQLGAAWPRDPELPGSFADVDPDELGPFSGRTLGRTCYSPNIDANLANGEVVITWAEKEEYVLIVSKQLNSTQYTKRAMIETRGNVYGAIGYIEDGCFGATCEGSCSCRPIIDESFSFYHMGDGPRKGSNPEIGFANCLPYIPIIKNPPQGDISSPVYNPANLYDPSLGDAIGVDNELARKSRWTLCGSPDVGLSESGWIKYPTRDNGGSGSVGIITYAFKRNGGLMVDQRYHNYLGFIGNDFCNRDINFPPVIHTEDDVLFSPGVPWAATQRRITISDAYNGVIKIGATARIGYDDGDSPNINRDFVAIQSYNTVTCDDVQQIHNYSPIQVFGRSGATLYTQGQILNLDKDITNRANTDAVVSFAPDLWPDQRVNVGWSVYPGLKTPDGSTTDILIRQYSLGTSAGDPLLLPVQGSSGSYGLANRITPAAPPNEDPDPASRTRWDGHLSLAGRHIYGYRGNDEYKTPNVQAFWEANGSEMRSRSSTNVAGLDALTSMRNNNAGTNQPDPKQPKVELKGQVLKIELAQKGEVWKLVGSHQKVLYQHTIVKTGKQTLALPPTVARNVKYVLRGTQRFQVDL